MVRRCLRIIVALFQCGLMYTPGKETEENRANILSWIDKAAEQGDADVPYRCGMMYLDGEGRPSNKEKACACLEKAAEQGYTAAQSALPLLADDQR